jgi:hypothetical protein
MKKAFFDKSLPSIYRDVRKQVHNFACLASRYGQFQTIREQRCLDSRGAPIPWYTYPAIEYLSHLDFSNRKILEYGSGSSTLWWASRCGELVSIENNSEWYERTHEIVRTQKQVSYRLETREETYVRQDYLKSANVIVIDGVHRSKCADWTIESIHDDSRNANMLIFDNADWYPNSIRKLRESLGWMQVDFHGFGPINDYSWTTSVFINPDCRHEIRYLRPLLSICGLAKPDGNPDDLPK